MTRNSPEPHPRKPKTFHRSGRALFPAALLFALGAAGCSDAADEPESSDVLVFNARPAWFHLDRDEVLWVEDAPGPGAFELRAAPRAETPSNGLEARRLGAVKSAVCAAADDAIYCGAADGIDRVPREGGGSSRFVHSGEPISIAVDADFVYWATRSSLDWAARDGGGATSVLLPEAPLFVRPLGGSIFVATLEAVYEIDGESGAVTRLAEAEDFRGAFPEASSDAEAHRVRSRSGFVALPGKLAWLVGPSAKAGGEELGALVEIPTSGGEARVLASGLSAPDLLAGDAEGYAWYEPRQAEGGVTSGAILRLGAGASAPEVATEIPTDGAGLPAELVASSGEIYWALAGSDEGDFGAIRRTRR